jgi:hypothetical protein
MIVVRQMYNIYTTPHTLWRPPLVKGCCAFVVHLVYNYHSPKIIVVKIWHGTSHVRVYKVGSVRVSVKHFPNKIRIRVCEHIPTGVIAELCQPDLEQYKSTIGVLLARKLRWSILLSFQDGGSFGKTFLSVFLIFSCDINKSKYF